MLAKGMSWMKTNAKVMMDDSDATIADLIVDGCNMGIKTLCRYENQYAAADDAAMKLTDDLIRLEEKLRQDLRNIYNANQRKRMYHNIISYVRFLLSNPKS